MKDDTWRCLLSEPTARVILRSFETCQREGQLDDISELLRVIRVQHPYLESEFPSLPWPGRSL